MGSVFPHASYPNATREMLVQGLQGILQHLCKVQKCLKNAMVFSEGKSNTRHFTKMAPKVKYGVILVNTS